MHLHSSYQPGCAANIKGDDADREVARDAAADLVAANGRPGLPGGIAAPCAPVLMPSSWSARTSGSALEFVPSRIAARQGTRVRLVYVNQGTLPHNLVLVWDGEDIDRLEMAALEAGATGYVPLEHRDRLIAFTALAGPGDTVRVEFEVPPPGEYPFVCLYPGHHNMMLGTLRSLR